MHLGIGSFGLVLATLLALSAPGLRAQTRGIQQIGAAIPGKTFRLRLLAPQPSAGRGFVFAATGHTDLTAVVPPYAGTLQLDLNVIGALVFGTFPAKNALVDLAIPVPNVARLLGLTADAQFLDGGTIPATFSDEVVTTVVSGVGTAVFGYGSPATTYGFDVNRVQNTTVGKPEKLSKSRYTPEVCKLMPPPGWSQGYYSTFGTTNQQVDPRIHKRDIPVRDMADRTWGAIVLPTGKRLTLVRDLAKQRTWLMALIDDKTGALSEIPDTRVPHQHPTNNNVNPIGDWIGVSADGKVAFVVVDWSDDSSALRTVPLRDKVCLVKLDGTKWSNGRSVLDVTPAASVTPAFDVWSRSIMPVSAGVFYRGRKDKGSTFFVPWDGSYSSVQVPLEQTGQNKDPFWIWYDSYRVSRDGKTLVFPTGSGPDSGNGWLDELEVYGLDNITATNMAAGAKTPGISARKLLCLTRFKNSTSLEASFGAYRGSATSFNAALSMDGKIAAVIGGHRLATPVRRNALYVLSTSGSLAGKIGSVLGFPNTVSIIGLPHFMPTGNVLVFGGPTDKAMDLFRVAITVKKDTAGRITSIVAATPINITKKGDLHPQWSLVSDNGLNFFFGRGHKSGSPGIDILHINAAGILGSVSGSEFGMTKSPRLELADSTAMHRNEFRMAPNKSGDIYFLGRQLRSGQTFYDQNVYRFSLEKGGSITRVTSYTGTASSLGGTVHLEGLHVLSDGSVVYAASKGAPSALKKQVVTWLSGKPASKPIEIGKFASGAFVKVGSIRVNEASGAVYWIQADDRSSTNTRGFYASLDNALKGHPLQLTDAPRGSNIGHMVNLSAGSANN